MGDDLFPGLSAAELAEHRALIEAKREKLLARLVAWHESAERRFDEVARGVARRIVLRFLQSIRRHKPIEQELWNRGLRALRALGRPGRARYARTAPGLQADEPDAQPDEVEEWYSACGALGLAPSAELLRRTRRLAQCGVHRRTYRQWDEASHVVAEFSRLRKPSEQRLIALADASRLREEASLFARAALSDERHDDLLRLAILSGMHRRLEEFRLPFGFLRGLSVRGFMRLVPSPETSGLPSWWRDRDAEVSAVTGMRQTHTDEWLCDLASICLAGSRFAANEPVSSGGAEHADGGGHRRRQYSKQERGAAIGVIASFPGASWDELASLTGIARGTLSSWAEAKRAKNLAKQGEIGLIRRGFLTEEGVEAIEDSRVEET